ncbi:hypothetical protein D3C72_1549360 [compost metagenome]
MGETKRQFWLHHRNLSSVFPKGVADIPPALAIANRAFGHLIGFKAVAAIRPQQRKRQNHHDIMRGSLQ